ncbi:MAG: protein kinase [Acidobacteria bacterium]|nr:protein kinase [Acidobacteriota bacterium]
MAVSAGTRLGPYETLAPLGAGGMGEVYRARDHKLDRDVALKVLPSELADDPSSLARFEREAKAVASLSHPNIMGIYDFGRINGTAFAIMELLEGETLRERLDRGGISAAQAIGWATQIAEGVAAAHDRGIVHRDLKPENIVLTRGDRIKILDFGLAKVLPPLDTGRDALATQVDATCPGLVLGTVGYMAPEQLQGQDVDHRADIFALGCILYEMLAGRRAFAGVSAIETMALILRDDPPDLPVSGGRFPPAIGRIVTHCLEKDPARRFQSMRDVVFDLSTQGEASTWAANAVPKARVGWARRLRRAGFVMTGAALAAAAFWLGTTVEQAPGARAQAKISYQTVSFGRGIVDGARFGPDGQTVVYGAAWDGGPFRLFWTRPGSPDTTSLELPDANLLAVSSTGELAIALGYQLNGWMGRGTLGRVPMLGAAPRQVADDVLAADWAPDGSELAVVRWTASGKRLEYPVGTVIYQTAGWISHPRLSADGRRIAFIDHPVDGDDRGSVAILDLASRTRRAVGGEWSGAQGLSWAPSSDELFFSAYDGVTPHSVYAVDLKGRTRQLLTGPTGLFLQDVAPDGRLLVASQTRTVQVLAKLPGDTQPRDLSWLSYSFAIDVSDDGRQVLLECAGDSCGQTYTVLVRGTDGSPAVRLGEGSARDLSPDGRIAAALVYGPETRIVLYPLGAGQPRTVGVGGRAVDVVSWLPDGRGLVAVASEPGHGRRGYTIDPASGSWRPFTAEGVGAARRIAVTPDGKSAALLDRAGRVSLFPLDGGPERGIPGVEVGDEVVHFSADGRELFVTRREVPLRVYRVDRATGRRDLWTELPSPDPAGLQAAFPGAVVSLDGRTVVGTYTRRLNRLYLVSGVR